MILTALEAPSLSYTHRFDDDAHRLFIPRDVGSTFSL
jgi:hypothetical protein